MQIERTPIIFEKFAVLFDSMDENLEQELPHQYGPSNDFVFLHKNWGSITELPDLRMYDQNNYGKLDDEEYFQLAVSKGMLKGCTPEEILILAIKGNSLKYLKGAINLGANVNTSYFQYTSYHRKNCFDLIPIIFASQIGNINIVKYLVKCGADIFLKDKETISALRIASAYGNLEVVKYLLEIGFDVNERKNENALFPIEYTIANNQYEVAKYLLEKGSNNVELHNPFLVQQSFQNGWLKFAKLFMEFGANINGQNDFGSSALHSAIYRNDLKKALFLIENGADIYFENDAGETSLDIARIKKEWDIFNILKTYNRSYKLKKIMNFIKAPYS